jgi:hypothetical protein
MPIFKTTQEIFSTEWRDPKSFNMTPPTTYDWNLDRKITISDVERWEQIYHSFGDVGIYAAWRPKAEFYIVVHDLLLDNKNSVREFHGNNAVDDVLDYARSCGITLQNQLIWIDHPIST